MYHVSAQDVDERMINVHYYYYLLLLLLFLLFLLFLFIIKRTTSLGFPASAVLSLQRLCFTDAV